MGRVVRKGESRSHVQLGKIASVYDDGLKLHNGRGSLRPTDSSAVWRRSGAVEPGPEAPEREPDVSLLFVDAVAPAARPVSSCTAHLPCRCQASLLR